MTVLEIRTEADRLNEYLATKDREEFDWLFRRFHSRLLVVALKLLRSDAGAEDCVHEAWLRLMTRPAPKKPVVSPMYFLAKLVKRQVGNYLRKANRGVNKGVKSLEALCEEALQNGTEFDIEDNIQAEVMILETEWDEVRLLLDSLNPNQRQAVELYYSGKSGKEVAVTLNVPLSTARNWAWRGLQKIQDSLEVAA